MLRRVNRIGSRERRGINIWRLISMLVYPALQKTKQSERNQPETVSRMSIGSAIYLFGSHRPTRVETVARSLPRRSNVTDDLDGSIQQFNHNGRNRKPEVECREQFFDSQGSLESKPVARSLPRRSYLTISLTQYKKIHQNGINRKPEVECRERFIWEPSAC